MLLRQTLPVERDFAEVQWLLQEVQTWSYQELDHRENKLTVFTLPFFDGCTGDHNQQHSELPHEHVIDDRSAGEENRGGPQQGSRRRSMHSMNMAYEREFGEQLARITRSVESPSEAELLYVPACLSTMAFTQHLMANFTQAAWAVELEREIVDAIAKAREFPGSAPQTTAQSGLPKPVMINMFRCPHSNPWSTFPTLWHNTSNAIYICIENPSFVTSANSLHVPFYVASGVQQMLPAEQRKYPIYFSGTLLEGRKHSRSWIRTSLRQEWIHVFDKRNILWDEFQQDEQRKARARFLLAPAGDAPTSSRIYQGLATGSIPFLSDKVKPPFNLSSWEGLAIEAWEDPMVKENITESPIFRHALATYDSRLRVFENARRILVWGSLEFLAMLELQLRTMVAHMQTTLVPPLGLAGTHDHL